MEPIAIVGMACRFPGADGLESFWRVLRDGRDAVGEVPSDRWDPRRFPGTSRWGGFLPRVDGFDPSFFGISPREAAYMDPQQRLLLEVAWEALEDAGLPLDQCSGHATGVFVGISTYDYGALQLSGVERIADGYVNTGGALSIAANRISYLFDFRGPSIAVDTACSSSLAAVHLACQSLGRSESEVALAGGVNLILTPAITIGFSRLKAMASDGRCKTFDARADGYVRGEGAGIVVLKPLARARADGDRIYAVIRGSALNQDGRTNGLTAPNGLSQEALVRQALRAAGVEPARIGYVEAHGTGTPLGDPIELTALGTVLGEGREPGAPCAVGSVKTNLGHLEAAAGVAGLMKLALALYRREIPPSLHFQEPNPHIPFDRLPLEVARALTPWPERMRPALGGVSSFGFGGTNVHVVAEEPPLPDPALAASAGAGGADAERAHLLPLSARSPDALRALARAWLDSLGSTAGPLPDAVADAAIGDLAYTAARRCTHHEHRVALVARSRSELAAVLEAFLAGETRPGLSTGRARQGRRRKVVFVFPGQGAQWLGMACGLAEREPVFRRSLEECGELIRAEGGWSLHDVLHASAEESRLGAVDVIQPALFAIQVALAELWRSWGVVPDAAVGHSMGEVAAACVAGRLGLADGARVICRRSRLLRKTSGQGAMAAVELSIEDARRALSGYEDRLSIAVSNSPSSTVLSGDPSALEDVIKALEARSVFCRRVKVDVASHSPQMDPLRSDLLELLDGVHSHAGVVPLYSTVIGRRDDAQDLDATYWVRNLREPVLFSTAVERLVADGHGIFLEVSPHPILLPAVQQTLRHLGQEGTILCSLRREEDEQAVMLGSLGALFALGKPVRWDVLHPRGRLVRLPSYPWQRERFWLEERKPKERSASGHPLLGAHTRAADDGRHFWDVELSTEAGSWLADHRVQGSVVAPAATLLEMALAAAREAFGPGPHEVADAEFKKALLLPDKGEQRLQLVVSPALPGTASFQFLALPAADAGDGSPVLHASGTLRLSGPGRPPAPAARAPLAEIQARCDEAVSPSAHYERAAKHGLDYGAGFRVVQQAWRRDGEAVARLALAPQLEGEAHSYRVHPTLLDGCFQALAATLPASAESDGLFLPVSLAALRVAEGVDPSPAARWAHAVLRSDPADLASVVQGDVFLLDDEGSVALAAEGLRLTRVDGDAARPRTDEWFYEVRWQPSPLEPPASDRRPAAGRWLLFTDERGVGDALRRQLEERGEACLTVAASPEYAAGSDGRYGLDPARPEQFRRLLQEVQGNGHGALKGVVHLWGLDAAGAGPTTLDTLAEARDRACASAVHLVQGLALTGRREKPRLWLVTAGAQAAPPGEPVEVASSLLWGLARTIAHEHPELACSIVDVGAGAEGAEVAALAAEISADGGENQVALRGAARYVARLARFLPQMPTRPPVRRAGPAPARRSFRLETTRAGLLENLTPRAVARRKPGAGEVEIRVAAAGLNFHDVLLALGLIPGLPDGSVPLGLECAGTITAVGSGVERLRAGDEVIAIASPGFSTHVVTRADFVAPKPRALRLEEAATVPVAFLTAHYALCHLGRLAAGERVLIHSASGGVGLAAIQIARRLGARIYATAGTPEKRDFLRSLGIEHVSDSRSLAFAEDVMAWTGGEGVDVVLNSLAGEAIGRGLALLAPGGRFLELGKRDIFQNSSLGLRLLSGNRSVFAIDLDHLSRERPAFAASMLAETMRFFVEHGLEPLPHRVFPAAQAESAFRHMAQGSHIGKVLVSMEDDPELHVAAAAPPARLAADATYLVTGGLGALGLLTARWLVERGARHLVLLSRRGPSAEAQASIDALEKAEAEVVVAKADVADPRQMAAVVSAIGESNHPLRGVIHAAGVLDDGILLQMDAARLRSVMAPKVDGAWNLHRLTSGLPLDFFVLFSSAAGVLGSPGQANYAAASAFLDALAHHRQAQGLSALSIDWGPWSDIGLAASAERGGRLAAQGIRSLAPRQGLAALARAWETNAAQVSVVPFDWAAWRRAYRAAASAPLLAELLAKDDAAAEPAAGPARAALLAASPAERSRMVETHLRERVANVLRLPAAKLDVNQPLNTLGIDSLMAVELKNRIETELQVSVPLIKVIQGPSVAELSALLLHQLAGENESPAVEPAEPARPPDGGRTNSLLLSLLSLGEDQANGR